MAKSERAAPTKGAAPESKTREGRHHLLDGIRGLAALGVANYHFLVWNYAVDIQSMGTFSVYLFFVLSSLTMMMVYGDRFSDRLDRSAVAEFFKNRFARLFPLLAAMAVTGGVHSFLIGEVGAATAAIKSLLTGSGLFTLQLPGYLSSTNGAWSLGIEIGFYAVFPIIALLSRQVSTRRLVAIFLVLTLAQQMTLWQIRSYVERDLVQFWGYYSTPIMFAPFFAAGLLIHRARPTQSMRFAVAAIALLILIMGFSLVAPANLFLSNGYYLLLLLMTSVCVLLSWKGRVPTRLVVAAAFLGDTSYALYLTHWMASALSHFVSKHVVLPPLVHWALFLVVALTGAYLCHIVFERPCRRWLRGKPRREDPIASLP